MLCSRSPGLAHIPTAPEPAACINTLLPSTSVTTPAARAILGSHGALASLLLPANPATSSDFLPHSWTQARGPGQPLCLRPALRLPGLSFKVGHIRMLFGDTAETWVTSSGLACMREAPIRGTLKRWGLVPSLFRGTPLGGRRDRQRLQGRRGGPAFKHPAFRLRALGP